MKVRAIKIGYINNQRKQVGDIFVLVPLKRKVDGKDIVITPEKQFSVNWMEKIEDAPAQKPAGKPAPEPEQTGDATGDKEVI